MGFLVCIDGKTMRGTMATVPVLDRGFLYGDSVYEVIRTYGGRPFAVSEHLDRLQRSARRLHIDLPERAWLEDQVDRTIAESKNPESYCRIIVTRGSGPITLDPTRAEKPMTVILVKELESFDRWMYEEGISLYVPDIRRNPPSALDPAIKSGNYLNSVLALGEARRAGYDDALLLGTDGVVTESTSANVFAYYKKENTFCTPALAAGILEGVTRGLLLKLAKQAGIDCRECDLSLEELLVADEVMLSGTLKEVMPVAEIGGERIGDGNPGPVAKKLLGMLRTHALAANEVNEK